MKITKRILSVIIAVLLCLSPLTASAVSENDSVLRFGNDHTFKIMQLSDLHQEITPAPSYAVYCIEESIRREQPDLIVITGDNIHDSLSPSDADYSEKIRITAKAIDRFMSVLNSFDIPIAVVFGNHDAPGNVSKEEQMKIYKSYSCCVAIDEEAEIFGCGTYNLPILASGSDKTAFNIWCFDTNDERSPDGSYDRVRDDQLAWYSKKSDELKQNNSGIPVPSLVFQHIGPREITDAIKNESNILSGEVCNTPLVPSIYGNEFEVMQSQGDVLAIAYGHDHDNNYVVSYNGIDLIGTTTSGFTSHGSFEKRGCRIFILDENNPTDYKTYTINYESLLDEQIVISFKLVRHDFNDLFHDAAVWRLLFKWIYLAIKNQNLFPAIEFLRSIKH